MKVAQIPVPEIPPGNPDTPPPVLPDQATDVRRIRRNRGSPMIARRRLS